MLVFELCCARRPGNDRVAVTAEDSFVLAVFVWIWQLFFFFWQGIVRFSSLLVGSLGGNLLQCLCSEHASLVRLVKINQKEVVVKSGLVFISTTRLYLRGYRFRQKCLDHMPSVSGPQRMQCKRLMLMCDLIIL